MLAVLLDVPRKPAIRRMYPTFRPRPNGLKHGTLPQHQSDAAMPALEKVAVHGGGVGAGFACFHELDCTMGG